MFECAAIGSQDQCDPARLASQRLRVSWTCVGSGRLTVVDETSAVVVGSDCDSTAASALVNNGDVPIADGSSPHWSVQAAAGIVWSLAITQGGTT
jgi:hypothetical protein